MTIKTLEDLNKMEIGTNKYYPLFNSNIYKIRRDEESYFTIADDELIRGKLFKTFNLAENDEIIQDSEHWLLNVILFDKDYNETKFATTSEALEFLIEKARTDIIRVVA